MDLAVLHGPAVSRSGVAFRSDCCVTGSNDGRPQNSVLDVFAHRHTDICYGETVDRHRKILLYRICLAFLDRIAALRT